MDSLGFVPPPSAERHVLRILGIVLGVIVFFILIGVGLLLFTPWGMSARTALGILTMPTELRSAVFIGTSKDGHTLAYQINGTGLKSIDLPDSMSSMAFDAAHQVVLAWHPTYHQLFLDGKPFLESTTTLAHVSVSPDGAWIGVSESTTSTEMPTPFAPEPLTGPNARGWSVVLRSTKHDRAPALIAAGSSPVFTKDMLLWLDPRGVVGMKFSDGVRKVLINATSTSVVSPLEISADGTLIAVRTLSTHRIDIYRIVNGSVDHVSTVPDTGSPFFALGNHAVYLARVNQNGSTDIWEEPFDGRARIVLTLPSALSIRRIILPSP